MKRLVTYKFYPSSKWAVLSGVLMGLALFARTLNFLGLRTVSDVPFFQLLTMLILPLVTEAVWCVCLRLIRLERAAVYGILGAIACLLLLVQSFFLGNGLLALLFATLLLISGAALVMVSWGWIPRRGLGFLILFVVTLVRIFVVYLQRCRSGYDWMGMLTDLPAVCELLAMTCYFGSLKKTENNE